MCFENAWSSHPVGSGCFSERGNKLETLTLQPYQDNSFALNHNYDGSGQTLLKQQITKKSTYRIVDLLI